MQVNLKPITWLGNSQEVVRNWPIAVRKLAGAELMRLQMGSEPLHWKPMKAVGRGVKEIRISQGGAYRVFYVVRRREGISVLHAFEKKSRRTAMSDIDMGKQRFMSEK